MERLTQRYRFASLLVLIAAASSTVVPSVVVGQGQGFEVQEIQTLLDRYEGALNTSDVDAVIALYADDGIFMPSSAPTAAGIESVRAAYEYVFGTIKLNVAFTVEEIFVDGLIAFARTGSKGTVTILADGTTAPEENRELFVFQKQDDVWKIARYMFNKTS